MEQRLRSSPSAVRLSYSQASRFCNLRLMAMRIRHGEATEQDADFVDDIYDVPR